MIARYNMGMTGLDRRTRYLYVHAEAAKPS